MTKLSNRRMPARTITVSSSPVEVTTLAVDALASAGFSQRTQIGTGPVVLEFGSAANDFFLAGFGFLPGPIGKHAFAVVEAIEVKPHLTRLTLSVPFSIGVYFASPFADGYSSLLEKLRSDGTLVEVLPESTSYEMPKESPTSPPGFRAYWKNNTNFFTM
jgi:hypothetical protein